MSVVAPLRLKRYYNVIIGLNTLEPVKEKDLKKYIEAQVRHYRQCPIESGGRMVHVQGLNVKGVTEE